MQRDTRKLIQKSFMKIAKTKPVDKITVREIVEDCQINRNSFYYHFEDLPALIESILEEQMLFLWESVNYSIDNLPEVMRSVSEKLMEDRDVWHNVYTSKNRALLDYRIMSLANRVVRRILPDSLFDQYHVSQSDREVIIRTYRCEIVGQVLEWLEGSMDFDFYMQYMRMAELRRGALQTMLERASRG